MTIKRGQDWGRPGRAPADLEWFDDDASVAEAYTRGRREVGVRAGDMARTLGVDSARDTAVAFPVDLLEVSSSVAGVRHAFAHVIVRSRRGGWWRGPILAVMNAQYLGRWDVAPRGHPNDGRAESLGVDGSMSFRQRLLAARRLPTGSHLPHPEIRVRSVAEETFVVDRRSRLDLDGREWAVDDPIERPEVRVTVRVVPDALVVWIAADEVR